MTFLFPREIHLYSKFCTVIIIMLNPFMLDVQFLFFSSSSLLLLLLLLLFFFFSSSSSSYSDFSFFSLLLILFFFFLPVVSFFLSLSLFWIFAYKAIFVFAQSVFSLKEIRNAHGLDGLCGLRYIINLAKYSVVWCFCSFLKSILPLFVFYNYFDFSTRNRRYNL